MENCNLDAEHWVEEHNPRAPSRSYSQHRGVRESLPPRFCDGSMAVTNIKLSRIVILLIIYCSNWRLIKSSNTSKSDVDKNALSFMGLSI